MNAGYKKIIIFATNYKARKKIKELLYKKPDLLGKIRIELVDSNYII